MKSVVLFDGYCNFCSITIGLIRKYDIKKLYCLVALQSEDGKSYLDKYNINDEDTDSVILIVENIVYIKSSAVLEIAKDLDGWIAYLYILRYIPLSIRDFLYDVIAKNRYRLFGKRETCAINFVQEDK